MRVKKALENILDLYIRPRKSNSLISAFAGGQILPSFGYVSTKNQMADHLTKPLPRASLERARGHCLGSRRIKFPVEFSKFELNPPPSKSPGSGGFREGVIEVGSAAAGGS